MAALPVLIDAWRTMSALHDLPEVGDYAVPSTTKSGRRRIVARLVWSIPLRWEFGVYAEREALLLDLPGDVLPELGELRKAAVAGDLLALEELGGDETGELDLGPGEGGGVARVS